MKPHPRPQTLRAPPSPHPPSPPPPPGERPFKCESCSYLAANQHEVTRHARQVHDGPKPLRCPHCDYKTADRSNYKKHVELHLRPRQFLCPLCSYAASKKCNLQYHLKSRHRGCTVEHLDLSKVKLRVKRPDGRRSGEEQEEQGEEQEQEESTPINLSVRKSGRSTSTASDKVQKNVGQVPEKVQKVWTRGKKTQDKKEDGEQDLQDQDTQTESPESQRSKRRAKKVPTQRKTVSQEPECSPDLLRPVDLDKNHSPECQKAGQQGDPRAEEHQELQKSSNGSEKDLRRVVKPRRSGSKRSEATKGDQEDGVQRAKRAQMDLQVKEKPPKRKISEALDLSSKASSETRSKSRRLKAATPVDPDQSSPATCRSRTGKQKKTNKKVLDLQQAPKSPVSSGPGGSSPPEPERSEPRETSTQKNQVDPTRPAEPEENLDCPAGTSGPAEPEEAQDLPAGPEESQDCPTEPGGPAEPEETQEDPAQVDDEGIHSSPEAGSDISDSASEGSDDSGLKMANDPETPTGDLLAPPTPELLAPPTPDLLAPPPSGGEVEGRKSLLCIFCDRSFPLQSQYRRHLQRHLVNVYFLDHLGSGK